MTTSMTHPAWLADLKRVGACHEAVEWAAAYPSLAEAWTACERGDWMLWWAGEHAGPRESAERKRLVLCACACARTALPYVKAGETRPLRAIETTERWARGEDGVTLADVRDAATAAADATYAAAADATYAATVAAYAATVAATAAADATYAATADAATAAAANVATYAAAAATERCPAVLKELADLVRQHYPEPPACHQ